MVIAVRQALDYHSTGRAIAVCLIGWVVQVVLVVLVMMFLGIGAAAVIHTISNTGLSRIFLFLIDSFMRNVQFV